LGGAAGTSVTLAAPSGWTVTPSGPATVAAIAEGSSASQSWTVTAPASGSGQAALPAALSATASYTSAGQSRQVTASQQAADTPAPPPAPVITSVTPSADPGGPVTITGQNFGATQGGSYLTLVQGGTSWGAPYDGAQVTITSWSDTSITVTLPPGSNYPWPLLPGTATITVTAGGQESAPQTLTITS
jgi:hypothetical protein